MSVPPTLFLSLCDSFWVFQIKVISQLYLTTQFENLPTNAFFFSPTSFALKGCYH